MSINKTLWNLSDRFTSFVNHYGYPNRDNLCSFLGISKNEWYRLKKQIEKNLEEVNIEG